MIKELKRIAGIIIVNQAIMWTFFIITAWFSVLLFEDNRNGAGLFAGYIILPAIFLIFMSVYNIRSVKVIEAAVKWRVFIIVITFLVWCALTWGVLLLIWKLEYEGIFTVVMGGELAGIEYLFPAALAMIIPGVVALIRIVYILLRCDW